MKLDLPADFAEQNAKIAEAACLELGLPVRRKFTDEELAPVIPQVKEALRERV